MRIRHVCASNRSCRCCQSTRNASCSRLHIALLMSMSLVGPSCTLHVAGSEWQVALGLNARPARHSPIKREAVGAHQNFLIFRHATRPSVTCHKLQQQQRRRRAVCFLANIWQLDQNYDAVCAIKKSLCARCRLHVCPVATCHLLPAWRTIDS